MELAVNTFSKGLQLDTHPMVQGTDTLTDCLNGTLLTMNGNEVILLNDMGNRRVNNAFLPPGYEPVGMKEYGGIIYVAAYNPITNKSQIGSFPSPLRKINNSNELTGKFDFAQFIDESNIILDPYLGIKVLQSDSFLVPLTGDYNLRAGDKFTIYSPDLYNYKEVVLKVGDKEVEEVEEVEETKKIKEVEENSLLWARDLITNFENTIIVEDKKLVKSPKNKKYTLSVGVLNSQNEFVDITKTLCRWHCFEESNGSWKSEIKSYDSSFSELYKFNDDYFIAASFLDRELAETINNANLIRERLKLAVNTYSYKLVGPLYLKSQLNHVENFGYNIIIEEPLKITTVDGEQVEKKIATVRVEGYFTYNCPDNVNEKDSRGNEDYVSFEEGIPLFNGFDFYNANNETLKKLEVSEIEREKSVYNEINNTYSVKISKIYELDYSESNIFNYVIGVNAFSTDLKVYLKGLSAKGIINFVLFGSGEISINRWKFYNEDNKTYLLYALEAYPKLDLAFANIRFIFTELSTLNSLNPKRVIYQCEDDILNGIAVINWDTYNFEPKKIYLVVIEYDVYSKNGFLRTDRLSDIIGEIKCEVEELSPTIDESYTLTSESKTEPTQEYTCSGTTKKVILKEYKKDDKGFWRETGGTSIEEEANSPDCGCFRWRAKYYDENNNLKSVTVENETENMIDILKPDEIKSFIPNYHFNPYIVEITPTNPIELTGDNAIILPEGWDHSLKELDVGSKIRGINYIGLCENLESLIIRPGVEVLYNFDALPNLKNIYLPKGIHLSGGCFNSCQSLESISIPDNTYGRNFLFGCPNLKIIKIGSNCDLKWPSYLKKSFPSLTDVYIFSDEDLPLNRKNDNNFILLSSTENTTWHVRKAKLEYFENKLNLTNTPYLEIVSIKEEEEILFTKEISDNISYNNFNIESQINDEDSPIYNNNIIESNSYEVTDSCRWFLSTSLFNHFYSTSIEDFCLTQDDLFLDRMKRKLRIDFDYSIEEDINVTPGGSLLSDSLNLEIKYFHRHIHTFNITDLLGKLEDNDYPCLLLSPINLLFRGIYQTRLDFGPGTFDRFRNYVPLMLERVSNEILNKWNNEIFFESTFSFNKFNGKFSGKLEWRDFLLGITQKEVTVEGGFDFISEALNKTGGNRVYAAIFTYNRTLTGEKGIVLIGKRPGSDILEELGHIVYLEGQTYNLSSFFNKLNSYIPKNLMFTYWNVYDSSPVLWRTLQNTWIVFPTLLTFREGINAFLKSYFGGNLVYCVHNNIKAFGIDSTNNNYQYTGEYSVPIDILIPIKCINPISIEKYSIGNLNFLYSISLKDLIIRRQLVSSEKFGEYLATHITEIENYLNFEVHSGIFKDIFGNNLNPTFLYYKINNQLIPTFFSKEISVIKSDPNVLEYTSKGDTDTFRIDEIAFEEAEAGYYAPTTINVPYLYPAKT